MCDFGREIRKKLIDLDKNRPWLVDQVKKKTGLYFDGPYLWRIEQGKLAPAKIVTAIKEILEI